jgi:hypothetical protein
VSAIFVSQPITVYEVDFLILDYDFWMASKQAITLAFVCGGFLVVSISKNGVLNPNSV